MLPPVFEPASIRLQMVFERWVMLKVFLAAVATGEEIHSSAYSCETICSCNLHDYEDG